MNLTVIFKIVLGVLNLPFFYWLIKRLTTYSISMEVKSIKNEDSLEASVYFSESKGVCNR